MVRDGFIIIKDYHREIFFPEFLVQESDAKYFLIRKTAKK